MCPSYRRGKPSSHSQPASVSHSLHPHFIPLVRSLCVTMGISLLKELTALSSAFSQKKRSSSRFNLCCSMRGWAKSVAPGFMS